jgi:hypothetical protein
MNIDEESKKLSLIKEAERKARYAPSARWDAIQAGVARIRANESQEYKAAREAAYAQARKNLGL